MLTGLRMAVCVPLALALAGCALAGVSRPPTFAELGLPDRYSLTLAAADEGAPATDTVHWWTLFDDPLLANLVERGATATTRQQIADSYISLRLDQARIVNSRSYLDALRETREVARYRVEAKLVTERDVLQIDAESARVTADIPVMQAAVAADAARIAVLVGDSPGALRDKLAAPGAIPVGPQAVTIGVPSDLIDRREDLRRAASPLGLGGKADAARSPYRQAVLAAQEDVENAVAAFNGAWARQRDLTDALAKAEAVARLAYQQYHDGTADYDTVADAEKALLGARDSFVDAQAGRARALIELCLALGSAAHGEAVDGN